MLYNGVAYSVGCRLSHFLKLVDLLNDSTLPADLSYETLPLWMQQARRRVDWGVVLALLLGLLSVWPFITRGGLPHGTALELYVHRTGEMAEVLGGGNLYPRWAPNLLYGYGLPLFNYAAPGSIYSSALFEILTESSAVDGVRFSLITGALIGSAGMFTFARRRWGPVAGLVAVGTFKLSPALLFLFPYVSGDLPLLCALQVLPAVFWALDRTLELGQGKDVGLLSVFLALLLLMDERAAPWLLLMVIGWLLWLMVAGCPAGYRGYRRAWVGIALGVGLSAIFWLPALAEQDSVRWLVFGNPTATPPLTLSELLMPSVALDLGAFNPLARRNLGLVNWLFGLGAVWGVLVEGRRTGLTGEKRAWLYFATLTALLILAIEGGQSSIDQHLLLGLLAFTLAVMAACITTWLGRLRAGRPRQLGLALLVGLPILNAFPTIYPPDWSADFGETGAVARLQLELDEYSLATVPAGEMIPSPFPAVPGISRPLLETYFVGLLDKVNRPALVSGRVDLVEHTAVSERLLVRAPSPIDVSFYISAAEGWRAYIDGQEVAHEVNAAGLLQVSIPSGEHELLVVYGDTPIRTLGLGLSVLSAIVLLVVIGTLAGRPRAIDHSPVLENLSRPEAQAAAVTLGVLLAAMLLLVAQPGLFWQRSPRGVVLDRGEPLRRYTQAGLDILAYDVPGTVYQPGDRLAVTLYWRTVRPTSDNYQVTVSLTEAGGGRRVAQSYKRHVGDYPTTRWPRNRYVRDWHSLELPSDLAPGQYLLSVDLWQCPAATLSGCQPEHRVEFFGDRGVSLGESLVLPVLVTVLPG